LVGENFVAYQNIKGASREKAMLAAYVLVNDFGSRQVDVAKLFRNTEGKPVSQGTIHQWVKEIGFQKTIRDLSNELAEAHSYALTLQLQIEDQSE
jgi:hypothetical protein